jgi:hypothetical protein
MRHGVEGAEAQRECQIRASGARTGDHDPKETRAILERATEVAGTLVGAQQLVVEVSMAGLEIDELETGVGRVHGSAHEVVGEGTQLVVGEKWLVGTRTDGRIHVGVTSHGDRRRYTVRGRMAHPTRVCELQTHDEVRNVAVDSLVLIDRDLSKRRKVAHGVVCDQQLRRCATPIGSHCGRLGPDQLGAALPHPPPPFTGRRCGASVEIGVPSLQWMDAEPVAGREPGEGHGSCQRRRRAVLDLGVERQLGADVLEVSEELVRPSELRQRADVGHAQAAQSAQSTL